MPASRRRGVEHPADQRALARCGRQSGHLDVAESVVGEVGLYHGLAAAPAVLVALRGAPQVGRVEGAVLAERLGVAQDNAGARGRARPEAAPAHHVLPHVVHVYAGGGLGHAHRPHLPDHPDRLVALRHEPSPLRAVRVRQNCDRRPAGGDETGSIPARHLPAGVVRLAAVDAGLADGAVVGRLPRRVGHHGLRGAVAQLQVQSQQQAAAGRPLHPGNGYGSGPPAATQLRAHGICSGADKVRDVERLVLQARPVEGPLRCQQAVADTCSVDPQFEQAQPGDGHGGMFDRGADGKLLAHHRGRLVPGVGCVALRRLRNGCQVGPRPTAHLHRVGRRHRCVPRHVPCTRENLEPGQREAEIGPAPAGQPGNGEAYVAGAHRPEAIALCLPFRVRQVGIAPVDDGHRVGEVGPPRRLDDEPHREQVPGPFRLPDAGVTWCAGGRDPRSGRMEDAPRRSRIPRQDPAPPTSGCPARVRDWSGTRAAAAMPRVAAGRRRRSTARPSRPLPAAPCSRLPACSTATAARSCPTRGPSSNSGRDCRAACRRTPRAAWHPNPPCRCPTDPRHPRPDGAQSTPPAPGRRSEPARAPRSTRSSSAAV